MTDDVRAKAVTLDEMIARMPPEDQREIERRSTELIAQHMALRDVRKAMGKTQATVAKRLGIKQENVARIEARGDMLLSTLRGYVQALGGDVHLTVELKGLPPIRLEGLGDLAPPTNLLRNSGKRASITKSSLSARRTREAPVG